jgi:hypothetical protein
VLLAAGAGVAFSQLASDSDTHRRAAGSVAPSDSPRTEFKIPIGGDSGSLSPTATVSSASPTATADLSAATKALAELDAKRQDAFARRAPTLLTGVYVAGPLLDQDVALLKRIVPAGCGLEGVHTAYSEVKVLTSTGTTLEVSATATLAQSILICQGKAKARAGGSGPTALRITLVKQGTGYLIADIQD